MARKKGKRIKNICEKCGKEWESVPSLSSRFCSVKCGTQGRDKDWVEKRKDTCISKYGVDVAFKSPEVREKYKKTLIEKYGEDNPFKVQEIKDKALKSIKDKYGYEIASQNHEVAKSISKSLKGREVNREMFSKIKYEKIQHYCEITGLKPLFDEEYLIENKMQHSFKNKFDFECTKCGEITSVFLSGGYLPTCKCSNYRGYSLIEEEIIRFLYEFLEPEDIKLNRRDLLKGRLEIDIYIPKLKLAIEVNGIYWHSESMGKYRDYHLYKTEKLEEMGIDLIHILDYEWLFKQPIIKSILRNKLNLNNTLYARKCKVKEIKDTKILRNFLDTNHIQGYTHASTNLGLYNGEELVSVMTFAKNRFKKNSNEMEMVRFCNKLNTNIVGGASKLFKHFEKNHNPQNLNIISFADRRFFKGDLYRILGFDFDKNTSPSYIYWKNNNVKSRMECQKHKLHKILEVFDENLSEYKNMANNGWRRVWDSGNSKWIKHYTQ